MEELSQPSKVKSSGGRPIVDVTETGDGELLAVTRGDSDG